MRILASPARRNRAANPYNFLLSEALTAQGCEVVDLDGPAFSRWDIFRAKGRWDVFHIHWPQHYAKSIKGVFVLVVRLLVQRMKGAKIVWTAHNLYDHDAGHPILERVLMWFVARLIHGVIFLSPSSRPAAYAQIPALRQKPCAIIPHGLYGVRSGHTPAQSRPQFGLPHTGAVVGFLGDIRAYKGLDLLLDAFAEIAPGRMTLFIAGVFADAEYEKIARGRLSSLLEEGHSVVLHERRLDHEALAEAIRACDLVALPYRKSSNSGLALLVLENQLRIIATDLPVFRELESELGSNWVRILDRNPSGDALISALESTDVQDVERLNAFCAARSWTGIGRATIEFYRQLVAA